MLKMAGVTNQQDFYKLYPDEKSFMAKHGKEFRKALRGAMIKKAQDGYNQQNAGMVSAASQAEVQSAIGNLSAGAQKKTVGQGIESATSDIPVVGGLVKDIVGIFDASNEAKQQKRAGALSDLQVQAANSAPRQQNRKYNRPDMDANVADINSLTPAQGTGSNLLSRNGITLYGKGGEIINTYFPNDIYTNGGYSPLSDEDKRKSFYYGGQVPRADWGSILSSALSSSGSSGSGGGLLSGILGGGNKTTGTTTTQDPAKQVAKSNVAQAAQTMESGVASVSDNKMSNAIGGIGDTVGSVIPLPGASQVLGTAGELIGDTITNNMGGTKAMARVARNNDQLAGISAAKTMQSNQQKYMRTGGNLRQNYPDMEKTGELNTLWGGHAEPISYNPYSPNGGETIMFRGNSHEESNGNGRTGIGVRYGDQPLKPYQDGGNANANVEVERGEPAMQMPDNTGNQNLVVFGNLRIPNQFIDQLGDPNAKGMKFKNYVASLSKQEDKQTKLIDNTNKELKDFEPITAYDKIKFDTLALNLKGANQKLKDLAEKKQNAAHLQQAINDTAEERGLDADALARGNVKQAKRGAKIPKGQLGANTSPVNNSSFEDILSKANHDNNLMLHNSYQQAKRTKSPSDMLAFKQLYGNLNQENVGGDYTNNDDYLKFLSKNTKMFSKYSDLVPQYDHWGVPIEAKKGVKIPKGQHGYYINEMYGEGVSDKYPEDENYNEATSRSNTSTTKNKEVAKVRNNNGKKTSLAFTAPKEAIVDYPPAIEPDNSIWGYHHDDDTPITSDDIATWNKWKEDSTPAKKQIPQYFNPMGHYAPPDKEDLDPRQLTGEYYALATNQLEPVPAQQYHPNLITPYEISLQDILNENTAATRGAQRFMGYNPAAQSNLVAQQYNADSKVLGEQFRINNEEKNKVYRENTNTLNDAQLKNLGILDQQYTRQAQALSNTKKVAQDALSSISAKYLQNQLENRTLGTYENMFNYRFDKNQHAWNMNGPAQWNMSGSGAQSDDSSSSLTPKEKQLAIEQAELDKKKKEAKGSGRNGAILKAMRNS